MTYPKMRPCPKCRNADTELYGYGEWGTTWHVECDDCRYMGPGGNKLQAIRAHNAAVIAASVDTRPEGRDAQQARFTSGAVAKPDAQTPIGDPA